VHIKGMIELQTGVNEELAKVNAYFEQLKPEYIEIDARKAEIQALKDAYAILDKKTVQNEGQF